MKTYEQEYNELKDWLKIKDQENSEARRKSPPVGLDGDLTYEYQQVIKEYNRRLIGLKEKYNKGLSEDEQIWKSANM